MLGALETPPAVAEPLFWADFIELRALIHPDRCYSRGDLDGLSKRLRDTSRDSSFNAELRWRDVANFSGVRKYIFGPAYPFSVSDDEDTLELNYTGAPAQSLYLCLLLSSLMRHIPKARQAELARYFEEMSRLIFTHLMPNGTEIRATWAHAGEGADYEGSLYRKMLEIASDLRCKPNFQERDFQRTNSGDGSIDLIAWHPMTDEREGMPIAFAQCGCSKDDWRFKQLEASPSKHYRKLPVMHKWATYYFLPVDLRHTDGDWAYKSEIGEAIIVDRLRLVGLAAQYDLHGHLPGLDLLRDVMATSYA